MRKLTCALLTALLGVTVAMAQDEVVGKRPYELDWAGRAQDDHPPLVSFEDLTGWQVTGKASEATLVRTREQQIWDRYVGKLTYRYSGNEGPVVSFGPPEPIAIAEPFDCVSCWIYGNNWGYSRDPSTPPVTVSAVFADGNGEEFSVYLTYVNWVEWHLAYRRLDPEQIARVQAGGAKFVRFEVVGGRNTQDRVLYFDNLAVFTEELKPLTFEPRPERGIPMFPGQTVGTNTGPGKLPFPNRPETILPGNVTRDFTTSLNALGDAYAFVYKGADGQLTWRVTPRTGMLDDLAVRWEGRGGVIRPCVGGGVYLVDADGRAAPPETVTHLGTERVGETIVSRWRLALGERQTEVTYTYRLWNKSLVVEVMAPGGVVAEVRYGRALGLENPRLVVNPYYHYGGTRPAVAVSGPPEQPLFLTGNTDWYLSNASLPFGGNQVTAEGVAYQGGTRYIPKTDGQRNDCYERLFLTLSPLYEEVLPNVANPKSPHMQVAGTKLWRAHGAGNRETDRKFWALVHRWGCTEVVITDHETGWRDGGESFTFRTRTAPGKGGDQGQYDYARFMQDVLGFTYGPYNNYTDFAPVNEYWTPDLIARTPDNQLQGAWMRCYAPKPARAVEFCAMLAPIIQEKFRFSTAYCDVHTAVAPWERTDYDARVPGAGTFAATYYSYGEIMLHQKAAWGGPVYSEGNFHFYYSGLTDGNYAQDRGYDIPNQPWLVDLDLRKMHPVNCNFGMGAPGMFYGEGKGVGATPEERDTYADRFLAATVAFGHPGFLMMEGGRQNMLRSYYMLQQLHSRYCLSSVAAIRYADAEGTLHDTSAAVASGCYQRSQVATRYADGTCTVVNGHPKERLVTTFQGRQVDLPPNGYVGWTRDGRIEVFSGDRAGQRCDYSVSPAYIYVDGRGRFTRFPLAASDGPAVCRLLPDNQYEVLALQGANCGFAVEAASAVALDEANKELGPAELRVSRGLTYVVPVEGAFSYRLQGGRAAAAATLTCDRETVVPGETVVVKGRDEHAFQVPSDAEPGARLWQQFEGAWIDFTVAPMADVSIVLEGNTLQVGVTSNLAGRQSITVTCGDRQESVSVATGERAGVAFDLGQPTEEAAETLVIELAAGDLRQRLEKGMRVAEGLVSVVPVPETYEAGMALRGQPETTEMGETGAHAVRGEASCGNKTKTAINIHPPWRGAVGYTFVVLPPLALPAAPTVAFRAAVGKRDGSDLGDGILYKLVMLGPDGREEVLATTEVTKHEWQTIEADLSPWAGHTVRLKLISDAGENDDSTGDWACWADLRIETLQPVLQRTLLDSGGAFARETGPFAVKGLTLQELRSARSGVLHYEGCGLEGTGQYSSYAVLNGVRLGNMARAAGNEVEGIYAPTSVPLTAQAIQNLRYRNEFELANEGNDYFSVRRFWIELELADGRKVSTDIAAGTWSQPPEWKYATGTLVPFGQNITVDLWFPR